MQYENRGGNCTPTGPGPGVEITLRTTTTIVIVDLCTLASVSININYYLLYSREGVHCIGKLQLHLRIPSNHSCFPPTKLKCNSLQYSKIEPSYLRCSLCFSVCTHKHGAILYTSYTYGILKLLYQSSC